MRLQDKFEDRSLVNRGISQNPGQGPASIKVSGEGWTWEPETHLKSSTWPRPFLPFRSGSLLCPVSMMESACLTMFAFAGFSVMVPETNLLLLESVPLSRESIWPSSVQMSTDGPVGVWGQFSGKRGPLSARQSPQRVPSRWTFLSCRFCHSRNMF